MGVVSETYGRDFANQLGIDLRDGEFIKAIIKAYSRSSTGDDVSNELAGMALKYGEATPSLPG